MLVWRFFPDVLFHTSASSPKRISSVQDVYYNVTRVNDLVELVPYPLALAFGENGFSCGRRLTTGFALLFGVHGAEGFGEAGADDEYVALLECHTLVLGDLLDLGDFDSVRVELVELDAVLVGPCFVVDENTSGDDASSGVPVCVLLAQVD